MQQPMLVTVYVKSVYGEEKVYPHNAAAILFAEIAGTKTLTIHTMKRIRQLGCTVEVMSGTLPHGF